MWGLKLSSEMLPDRADKDLVNHRPRANVAASCGFSAHHGGPTEPGAMSQSPCQAPCTWRHVCKPGSQFESDLGAQATVVAEITLSQKAGQLQPMGKTPQPLANPGPAPSPWNPCAGGLGSFRAQCPAQVPGARGPAHFPPSHPHPRREGQALVRREWGPMRSGPAGCGACGLGPAGCRSTLPSAHCSLHPRSWGHRRPSLDPAPCSLLLATARRQEVSSDSLWDTTVQGEGRWRAGSLPALSAFGCWC